MNLDKKRFGKEYQLKIFSENQVKLFFFISIIFVLMIPPITSPNSVILWEKISLFNYIRAIITLVSASFLPGASIYSLFFSEDKLSSKLKIDPIILKITLYPILSWGFIGIIVLILDQIHLISNVIFIFLIICIFTLFLIDVCIQKMQYNYEIFKKSSLKIKKKTLLLIFLGIGIALFSISIFLGRLYLFGNDDWVAISPTIYIGEEDLNPLTDRNYPAFWGYIIFGLSKIFGIPFVNTNAILAPFCYLSVTSSYIFFKTLISEKNKNIVLLSTILFLSFSGIFSILSTLRSYHLSAIIFQLEIHFSYKTYSYLTFLLSLSFIILIIKNGFLNQEKEFSLLFYKFKHLILSAYLLVLSFIVYMIPLLIGILLVFIFCTFYKKNKKSKNFKIFLQWLLTIISFIIITDIIMIFHLSNLSLSRFFILSKLTFFENIFTIIPSPIILYLFFGFFILIIYIIFKTIRKYEKSSIKKRRIYNLNKAYKIFFILFTFIVCIYLIDYILSKNNPFNYNFYLFNFIQSNIFFLNFFLILSHIGLIGIIYTYLSYYYFKSINYSSNFLFIWFLFSLIFALIPINLIYILEYDLNYQLFYRNLFSSFKYFNWFNRFWIYSLPSLCVFGAFGILSLLKKLKNINISRKLRFNNLGFKILAFSFITIISYSSLISAGMSFSNSKIRYSDNTIEMVGWISENLPYRSNILIYKDWQVGDTIRRMTYCNTTFFEDIFNKNSNTSQMEKRIDVLKKRQIPFALVSWTYLYPRANYYSFFKNYLIPDFYNRTIYASGDFVLYFAPSFL
jgi:hypothetical protein